MCVREGAGRDMCKQEAWVLILTVTNEWGILRGSIPVQLQSALPVMTGEAQYGLHVSRAILPSVSKSEYD